MAAARPDRREIQIDDDFGGSIGLSLTAANDNSR
jgi:hypothetical protein